MRRFPEQQRILAIDPSGAFDEGRGTTGYCLMIGGEIAGVGCIYAKHFTERHLYWEEHIKLIKNSKPDFVVVESYRLHRHKALAQVNSSMETPQLIGVITQTCHSLGVPITFQSPAQVKTRWSDMLLIRGDYVTKKGNSYFVDEIKVNGHVRDAIRHALHFYKFTHPKQLRG